MEELGCHRFVMFVYVIDQLRMSLILHTLRGHCTIQKVFVQ